MSEAAILQWVYDIAAQIDGEWGCCHSADEIRAGRTIPEEWQDREPEPLPDSCYGPGVVRDYMAARDAE